jgi:starvation-inducible DNA-binding protein
MIDLLNRQLADALDLGLQAKQAHWNVKGPHFIGLHELFDKVAEELEEFTDDIAERAVELGGVALGTIQIVSRDSRLKAYPLNLVSGREHVAALSGALAQFGTTTRSAIDTAAKAGDADTADLFTEVSRGVDKLLWFVEAHTQAKE